MVVVDEYIYFYGGWSSPIHIQCKRGLARLVRIDDSLMRDEGL
jgi:hypothetical protein